MDGDTHDARGINRSALLTFIILGILLSWYPWIIAIAQGKTSGPNPLGLLVAALIASAVDRGWRGPLLILMRIFRPRGPFVLLLAAVALPLLTVAAGMGIASYRGIHIAIPAPNWKELADQFLITFLFVALGEEPAWRGFLQPMLQRRFNPVIATLIVSALWAPWHIPLFGTEFAPAIIPAFLMSLVGGALLLAWLYNSTRWVLPCMLCHATINTAGAGFLFHGIDAGDLQRFWYLYALVWLGLGLLIALLTGGRLGLARGTLGDE